MMNHSERPGKTRRFDPNTFLATIGEGRKNVSVARKHVVFSQGDIADAVFYIKKGKVRLTVVSKHRQRSNDRDHE